MKDVIMDLHYYWNEIRSKVYVQFVYGDAFGACHLDDEIECPIKLQLPSLIKVLTALEVKW